MENEVTITEAIEMLDDGTPTLILPFFMVTHREAYIKIVLKQCAKLLKTPDFARIYLLIQEGISERKARGIWRELKERGKSLKNADSDSLRIYCFSNVPTELIDAFIQNAKNIEIRRESDVIQQ